MTTHNTGTVIVPDEPQRPDVAAGASAASGDPGGDRSRGLTRAMRYTLFAVLAVVLAGAVVSVALVLTPRADPDADAAPPPPPVLTPTQGPIPGATATTGSEVQSPGPAQTDAGRIPPLPTPTALISPPLPAAASAQGALVTGYPSDVAAPLAGSDIVSSAVAGEDTTLQITLVARTDSSPDDVTASYRQSWAALGLAEEPSEDASALTFAGPYATLSLGFTATGTGTVYQIYGVLRTS